jgi:hypothetical protein
MFSFPLVPYIVSPSPLLSPLALGARSHLDLLHDPYRALSDTSHSASTIKLFGAILPLPLGRPWLNHIFHVGRRSSLCTTTKPSRATLDRPSHIKSTSSTMVVVARYRVLYPLPLPSHPSPMAPSNPTPERTSDMQVHRMEICCIGALKEKPKVDRPFTIYVSGMIRLGIRFRMHCNKCTADVCCISTMKRLVTRKFATWRASRWQ